MEPQPTPHRVPIYVQIADAFRMRIERGDLRPGDSLPTLAELCRRWRCSANSARGAVTLLKTQGLITTSRGTPPRVRIPPAQTIRSSEAYQEEKARSLWSQAERATLGETESNTGRSLRDQRFKAAYDTIPAVDDLTELFGITAGTLVLRRSYQVSDSQTGQLQSASTSYLPRALIESNPRLLDDSAEPWPGGTHHQLATVGIEIMAMTEHVTARAATTVEVQEWGLPDGVPMMCCRRFSLDAAGRTVEFSDSLYPADRTALRFRTPLRRSSGPAAAGQTSQDEGDHR